MTELIKHPEFGEIRTQIIKGEPWFVAQDICTVLGQQNHRDILAKVLDEDEKGVYKIYTPGGAQEMLTVNESGLYALIMRSNKPAAKQFRKWVTSEVLPSIRRTGYYVHPDLADRKEERRLRRELLGLLDRYLNEDDKRKIAKKLGTSVPNINYKLKSDRLPNDMMQECQGRALANKERELNAYHPNRVREVVNKLSK